MACFRPSAGGAVRRAPSERGTNEWELGREGRASERGLGRKETSRLTRLLFLLAAVFLRYLQLRAWLYCVVIWEQRNNSYVKEKTFCPHGFVSGLVIKVNFLHFNLDSFWHALFDRNNLPFVDQVLGQQTGQTDLTATVPTILSKETRD